MEMLQIDTSESSPEYEDDLSLSRSMNYSGWFQSKLNVGFNTPTTTRSSMASPSMQSLVSSSSMSSFDFESICAPLVTPSNDRISPSSLPLKKQRCMERRNRSDSNRIKVAIRLRPLEESVIRGWDVRHDADDVCYLEQRNAAPSRNRKNLFAFDSIFDEDSKTTDVYETLGKPVVEAVASSQRQHGTIFAYGTTGSGKTFTMQGQGQHPGLIHLASKNLFATLELRKEQEFSVRVQYFEIYNEQVRDLLADRKHLVLREDASGEVLIDAHEAVVFSSADIVDLLAKGSRNRACAPTSRNTTSSRSHAVFRIVIARKAAVLTEDARNIHLSYLTMVDLAGSENISQTAATGTRKHEGGIINQSLLTLSQVISALSLPENKRPKHISFRSSKLTRLMKPQLTGNSSIAVISCISGAVSHINETTSTLKFASTAKKVLAEPKSATDVNKTSVLFLLQKELAETREALKNLERSVQLNKALATDGAHVSAGTDFKTGTQTPVTAESSSGSVSEDTVNIPNDILFQDLVKKNEVSDDTNTGTQTPATADSSSESVSDDNVSIPNELLMRGLVKEYEVSDDTPPVSVINVANFFSPLEYLSMKARLEEAEVKVKSLEEQLVANLGVSKTLTKEKEDLISSKASIINELENLIADKTQIQYNYTKILADIEDRRLIRSEILEAKVKENLVLRSDVAQLQGAIQQLEQTLSSVNEQLSNIGAECDNLKVENKCLKSSRDTSLYLLNKTTEENDEELKRTREALVREQHELESSNKISNELRGELESLITRIFLENVQSLSVADALTETIQVEKMRQMEQERLSMTLVGTADDINDLVQQSFLLRHLLLLCSIFLLSCNLQLFMWVILFLWINVEVTAW